MTADFLIRIGPLIGGVILMVICAVAILRNPAVSNVFAGLLAFGGLLFVIPALAFFNFKGLGIEFGAGRDHRSGLGVGGAGINARLEDIKTSLADLSRKVAPAAPPPPSADFGANRSSTVIVVYPSDPKMKILAKQMENDLLKKGYLATSVFSDYSELSDAKKGTPGSVRYVFTDPAKATSIKQLLKPETTGLTVLPDDQRQLMSADVQVLLF